MMSSPSIKWQVVLFIRHKATCCSSETVLRLPQAVLSKLLGWPFKGQDVLWAWVHQLEAGQSTESVWASLCQVCLLPILSFFPCLGDSISSYFLFLMRMLKSQNVLINTVQIDTKVWVVLVFKGVICIHVCIRDQFFLTLYRPNLV